MLSIVAALALSAPAITPGAEESFARRAFLLEADSRCELLTSGERASLSAAARQARGALERAGLDADTLEFHVRNAAAARDCSDELVQDVAGEARNAYAAWAAMRAMDFPGVRRVWTTRRVLEPDSTPRWALWQRLENGERFGLTVTDSEQTAMLAIPAERAAAPIRSAKIELRDPDKLAAPLDAALGGLFMARADLEPMAQQAAPASLSRAIWASGVSKAKGETAPKPDADFQLIEFPASALAEIARLNASEAVRIRVIRADGETVRYVEAGDLAAAQAFLAAKPLNPET
ncbi:MAG: hypothetical protein H2040_11410 [Euryhalocaulis sp.]|uniref:hypothetical protein n=1 Tax=Euryhalocaulis sp. TaxID=2744307 RepID=UPI0017EE6263|nr:hypothetical protein [Euryhalocaulis sp.]MBA4802461.1 hypothetical protein [Euryhalocaulis sp.]